MATIITTGHQASSPTNVTISPIENIWRRMIKSTMKESFTASGVKEKTLVSILFGTSRCLALEKRHLEEAGYNSQAYALKLSFPFLASEAGRANKVKKADIPVFDSGYIQLIVEEMRAFVGFMDRHPELLQKD
jgi:hypothetical protein